MERDSWGEISNPARSPALLQRPAPHRKTFPAPTTFGKPEAYALVGRLANLWPSLVAEPGQEGALASEYLEHFDGFDFGVVDAAVTAAIGKRQRRDGAPAPGDIKAEIRAKAVQETRPSERQGYRPTYDYSTLPHHLQSQEWVKRMVSQNIHPEYIKFRDRERYLHQKFVEHMKNMSPETMRKLGIDDDSIGTARKIMGGR